MPRAEAAQCHGIAQHVHGSDAVLPAVTHRAHEQIRRAWVDVSEAPLPIGPCFAAQPQRARRENDTPTIASKAGRSRCQPMPAPGAYSVTMSCSNASAGIPLIWFAISVK